jgi:hypothetical protein
LQRLRSHVFAYGARGKLLCAVALQGELVFDVRQSQQSAQMASNHFGPVVARATIFRLEQKPPLVFNEPELPLAAQLLKQLKLAAVYSLSREFGHFR